MSLKRLVVGGRLVVRPDYLQAEYQSMRPARPDCAPPPGVRDCAPPAQRRWWEIAAHKARSPKHAGLVLGLPGHARSTEPPRSPPADRDIALDRSVTPAWSQDSPALANLDGGDMSPLADDGQTAGQGNEWAALGLPLS